MKIAENVEMLEVKHQNMAIYPVLIWDDGDVVLVDSGYPGMFDAMCAEIAKCGFKPEQITKLILTHQDIDHIGNARLFKERGAQVLAYEEESPFIQGDKPLTKLSDMEANFDSLPPERKGFYQMLKDAIPNMSVHVDVRLTDGETLPICGGIEVIHTPGHTPGHIVLKLLKSGIVVCGDAANISDGKLVGANSAMTHDMAAAEESFKKILELGASAYECYHTGYLVNN